MKKELFIHFAFLVSLIIFTSIFKGWFSISYWPFWLGGILGTILPDIDHLVYVYFLSPQDLSSQRVNYMLGKKELWKTLDFLAATRYERTKLIFHAANFQVIFLILSFLIMTSSGSLLGKGLVLAFSLHLIVDQLVDMREIGNLDNWFLGFPINLDINQRRIYWWVMLAALLIFGFIF